MNKNLEYYLNLPWTYRVEYSHEDKCYVASIAELKGCMSDGETMQESALMIKEALVSHITALLSNGDEIPEPMQPELYKGKIAYRTTPARHYKIALKAGSLGKSISKTIDEMIDFSLFYEKEDINNPKTCSTIDLTAKSKFNDEFEEYLKNYCSKNETPRLNLKTYSWYKKALNLS